VRVLAFTRTIARVVHRKRAAIRYRRRGVVGAESDAEAEPEAEADAATDADSDFTCDG